MPMREDRNRLAEHNFQDFRLKVGGLVDNPVELSLAEIEKLGYFEDITMYHCIQGWTEWGGIPMKKLVELGPPESAAKIAKFPSSPITQAPEMEA